MDRHNDAVYGHIQGQTLHLRTSPLASKSSLGSTIHYDAPFRSIIARCDCFSTMRPLFIGPRLIVTVYWPADIRLEYGGLSASLAHTSAGASDSTPQ